MKKALVIGSKSQYEEIDLNALKNKGLDIYLAYQTYDIPLNGTKAVFYDKLNTESIKNIVNEESISVLVCYKDEFLYYAAEVRTQCNIQGIKLAEVKKYKYKSAMCDLASEKVLTVPYIKYTKKLRFEDLKLNLGDGPYFVKPDNLAGSEGSIKFYNKVDFQLWVDNYSKKYLENIIQPYMNEQLYHCEMVVQNGRVLYTNSRIYSYPNHKFLDGKIILSMPALDSEIKEKVNEAASAVREALNFNNGLMHSEFFVSEDKKVTFLETNIRQVGGTISLIHKDIIGCSFETILILIDSGVTLDEFKVNESLFHYAGYIPRKKGIVSRLNKPEFKGDVKVSFRVSIGDKLTNPTSTSDASASIYGKYNNYSHMISDFHYIENNPLIEYRV